ncbi:MAG: tetratricopeptide repeat protein [Pseudomonadota bacterium]
MTASGPGPIGRLGHAPERDWVGGSARAILIAGSVLCGAAPAEAQRASTAGDQSPAIIAGRDATIVYGITPLQLAEAVRAAAEGTTAPLARQIEDLRGRLGVTEGAALAMLRSLGRADISIELLPQALTELAAQHHALLERLRWLDGAEPEVQRLKAQARAAVERGDLDAAERALRAAEAEELVAEGRLRDELQRIRASRAGTIAERGALALLRLRYAEATALYLQAADTVPGSDVEALVTYLSEAGGAALSAGDPAKASIMLQRALAATESAGPAFPRPALRADVLRRLSGALGPLGDLDGAERRLREAIAIIEHSEERERVEPHLLVQLGALLLLRVRNDEAELVLRRALRLLDGRSDVPARNVMPAAQSSLAMVLAERDGRDEALALLQEAAASVGNVFGPGDVRAALPLHAMGVLLAGWNRLEEAEPVLRRALDLRERTIGAAHPETAVTRAELGQLRIRRGSADEGGSMIASALAALEQSVGPRHPYTIVVQGQQGRALLRAGRHAEGEALLRRALAGSEASFGADHEITAGLRQEVRRLGGGGATRARPEAPGSSP